MARKVQTSNTAVADTTKPRRGGAPPPDPDALLKQFKDFPAIDVITRRFNDPNDPGSLPILLKGEDPHCCVSTDHQHKLKAGATICDVKDPTTRKPCGKPARIWYVRYFNLAQEGRNAQMRGKGYVPVPISELQDADDIADLYESKKDTFVRRGDRGQEILGKQPLALYLEIKRRQRTQRMQHVLSGKKVQADLAEAAGRDLGDEAGQSLHDGAIQVESMTRSRTTLGEEAELDVTGLDV